MPHTQQYPKSKVLIFLEMIKFEHSIFALPFAYLGLVLAEGGLPRASVFWGVTAAMVSFRTMAMGLNRIFDQSIDAVNPRTQNRALPAKKLNVPYVWAWTAASWIIFEVAAYCLGAVCFYLSPIPVVLAFSYPFAKRFTWLSHWILGLVLGIAPSGAWLASQGTFSWIPLCITLGVTCWVAGFDIIYALQDEAFDRQYGLYSVPSRFGAKASLWITQILHGLTLVFWLAAGFLASLHAVYFAGMLLVALFLIREHLLVRQYGIQKMEEAFFSMNAWVSVTVFAAVGADLFSRRFLA